MGMAPLCFENSTASIINDIVCRAATEADGRMDCRILAQMGGHVAIYRWPNASCSCQIRTSTSQRAPAVITANICLPLGIGNGTTVHAIRILFPETMTFTPIEVSMAGGCIIVQLASYMLRFIVLQVRDGQGPSHQIPGPTGGHFPYMLPQTQALSVTLSNRRFTIMSVAFASSSGAA